MEDSIVDPLEADEMLKSAIIYRNGAFNYIYVCHHCECSFINISDILNHVENIHFNFDIKVNILDDNLDISEPNPEMVGETGLVEANKKKETISSQNVHQSDDNGPVVLEFECEIVEQKYKSNEDFEEDRKTDFNAPTNEYEQSQCKICRKMFKTTPQLIVHLMKVHVLNDMTTLSCPHCSQDWTDETEFLRHLQQHIDTKETTYDMLIDTLNSNCEVTVKLELDEIKPKGFIKKCLKKCDICSLTFRTKKCLISHMRLKHIAKKVMFKKHIYDCDKCDRKKIEGKFPFYAHHYGHLTSDLTSSDVVLQQKLKKFLDESIYCDESTANKTFGCKVCSHLPLKRRPHIEYHILQEHIHRIKFFKGMEKRFPCEYCGRKFAANHNLVVHKRTHTMEKPYTCLVCNKSFSQSSYMRYHEKIHTGLKPHQCATCGLSFKTNNKLNFHLKVHSNDTTKCKICNKELKPHRLNIHIRNVHENEHRPYSCSVCLQTFKTAKTLKTHSYRHTGEKNYKCRFHCDDRFVSSAGRRAHERAKHEPR